MAGDQQDPRRKILSRCYLVRYKPHMENSGSEATPLYWAAGSCLRHGL